MTHSTRFDNWNPNNCDSGQVDCNKCSFYWREECDGASEGSECSCSSFQAVRQVDIPLKLEALTERVKWLSGALIGITALLVAHMILEVLL